MWQLTGPRAGEVGVIRREKYASQYRRTRGLVFCDPDAPDDGWAMVVVEIDGKRTLAMHSKVGWELVWSKYEGDIVRAAEAREKHGDLFQFAEEMLGRAVAVLTDVGCPSPGPGVAQPAPILRSEAAPVLPSPPKKMGSSAESVGSGSRRWVPNWPYATDLATSRRGRLGHHFPQPARPPDGVAFLPARFGRSSCRPPRRVPPKGRWPGQDGARGPRGHRMPPRAHASLEHRKFAKKAREHPQILLRSQKMEEDAAQDDDAIPAALDASNSDTDASEALDDDEDVPSTSIDDIEFEDYTEGWKHSDW